MATFKTIILNVMAHWYKEKAIQLGENLPLYQFASYFVYDKPRIIKQIGIFLIRFLGHKRLAKDLNDFYGVDFKEFYSLLNRRNDQV